MICTLPTNAILSSWAVVRGHGDAHLRGSYFEPERVSMKLVVAIAAVLSIPWTIAGHQSAYVGANITLVVGAIIVVRFFLGWRRSRKAASASDDGALKLNWIDFLLVAIGALFLLMPSAAALSLRGPAKTFDLGAFELLQNDTAWSIAHDIIETGEVKPHHLVDHPFEDRYWRPGARAEDALFGVTQLLQLHGVVIGICHDGAMDQSEYDSIVDALALAEAEGKQWNLASLSKAVEVTAQSCDINAETIDYVTIAEVVALFEENIAIACSDNLIDRPTSEYDPIFSRSLELTDRLGEIAANELFRDVGLPPGCEFSEAGMFD